MYYSSTQKLKEEVWNLFSYAQFLNLIFLYTKNFFQKT
jgi:hypothetical protein